MRRKWVFSQLRAGDTLFNQSGINKAVFEGRTQISEHLFYVLTTDGKTGEVKGKSLTLSQLEEFYGFIEQ